MSRPPPFQNRPPRPLRPPRQTIQTIQTIQTVSNNRPRRLTPAQIQANQIEDQEVRNLLNNSFPNGFSNLEQSRQRMDNFITQNLNKINPHINQINEIIQNIETGLNFVSNSSTISVENLIISKRELNRLYNLLSSKLNNVEQFLESINTLYRTDELNRAANVLDNTLIMINYLESELVRRDTNFGKKVKKN